MQIIKKINTSAVLALDSTGQEIVVLGKGLGFPKVPYELTDLSLIDRTFYDVDPKYLGMIGGLPQALLLACAEIAESASITLGCQLNPNLPFTLADHINFAAERLKRKIDLTTPIAYDIRHLYPQEAAIAAHALEIIREQADVSLPESEVVSVAMHLINAEAESGNMHSLMMTLKILGDIEGIVEQTMGIRLDKNSYSYARFSTHLRYLIQRLESGQQTEERGAEMLRSIAREYPQVYLCALRVTDYLKENWGWQCNKEETLYLMMHINRVQEQNDLPE